MHDLIEIQKKSNTHDNRECPSSSREDFNSFTADPVKALHFAILVLPTSFNIWHPGALALKLSARAPECQKLKMVG